MEAPPPGVSQNELRELRRVFGFLAGFAAKQRLQQALAPARARLDAIARSPAGGGNAAAGGAVRVVDEDGVEVPPHVLAAEAARLGGLAGGLQRELDALDAAPLAARRIRPQDVQLALEFLGKPTDRVSVRGGGEGGVGARERHTGGAYVQREASGPARCLQRWVVDSTTIKDR